MVEQRICCQGNTLYWRQFSGIWFDGYSCEGIGYLEVKDYFIFLVFGKVAIFFLQTFPPLRKIKWKFLQEALDCDLCTGTWVYIVLAFIFGVNVAPKKGIVPKILTGASSSLLTHLVSIGFRDKFGVTNILYNHEE
jgi:hypothetical protein